MPDDHRYAYATLIGADPVLWVQSRDLRAMSSDNQTINLHSLPHRIVFEDPTKGYEECLFLQPQIDPDLKCCRCHLILRKPHRLTCCNRLVCKVRN